MKYPPCSRYLRLVLSCLIIAGLSNNLSGQSSKGKDLKKRKAKYWKNELKIAKSNNHKLAARNNPEIGWLSGLWCMEGDSEPYRHVELKGAMNFRMATRGYLAASEKFVVKPKTILFSKGEFLGKPVVVKNESHYDLWSFSGGKITPKVWYVFLERIYKVSDTQYKRVYAKSYTIRDQSFVFEDFIREKSPEIPTTKHYKEPKIYTKCK